MHRNHLLQGAAQGGALSHHAHPASSRALPLAGPPPNPLCLPQGLGRRPHRSPSSWPAALLARALHNSRGSNIHSVRVYVCVRLVCVYWGGPNQSEGCKGRGCASRGAVLPVVCF